MIDIPQAAIEEVASTTFEALVIESDGLAVSWDDADELDKRVGRCIAVNSLNAALTTGGLEAAIRADERKKMIELASEVYPDEGHEEFAMDYRLIKLVEMREQGGEG